MRWAGLAACVLFALTWYGPAQAEGEPGDFDFYVLALSWSPTWCATAPGAADSDQCGADPAHGLIVHGLWPQYENGYPEFCGDAEALYPALAASMLDIMTDADLVAHEWEKHGSCSGETAESYFELTRAAFERVSVTTEFAVSSDDSTMSANEAEAAVVRSNPGLTEDSMAISCDDGWLEEVRICMTRELEFRSCEDVDARGCRQRGLRLPAPE